jgi:hypothetical protein
MISDTPVAPRLDVILPHLGDTKTMPFDTETETIRLQWNDIATITMPIHLSGSMRDPTRHPCHTIRSGIHLQCVVPVMTIKAVRRPSDRQMRGDLKGVTSDRKAA